MNQPKIWPYYSGKVILNDWMGSDLTIVNAARASFGKKVDTLSDKDIKLIHYLAKNKHWSPFRQVQFNITIEGISEAIARQAYKHQVGCHWLSEGSRNPDLAFNESSGRYLVLEPTFHYPESFRKQHESNKQASRPDVLVDDQEQAKTIYDQAMNNAYEAYTRLLDLGVCKEQARMVMPLAFTTTAMFTASLEALVNFVRLRNHPAAQVEIQELAKIFQEIIKHVCPVATEALLESYK